MPSFLRVLGCIYAVAFVSFGVQAMGLIGSHGILPAGEYLRAARTLSTKSLLRNSTAEILTAMGMGANPASSHSRDCLQASRGPKGSREFEERVYRHRTDLLRLLKTLAADGKKVVGYGASTKGNVLLQFCGITTAELVAIAEVNSDKFGAYTPGTNIPIISEKDARAMEPDYFLVLPWHFKDGIVQREAEFLASGGRMIFPFPEIEIV